MKRIAYLAFSIGIIMLLSCEKEPVQSAPVIDIFALGSSFTNQYVYYFKEIADNNNDSVFLGEAAIGNAGLKTHIEESNTLGKLVNYEWDYIMIQESGYMACLPEEDSRESTFKCVELLVDSIKDCNPNARIGLFMTQAYERGRESNCDADPYAFTYEGMQARIIENYIRLAKEFNLELAPVGYFWMKFSEQYPLINLFSEDHSHGSPAGRYLTASIIYTTIFQKPVSGNVSSRMLPEQYELTIREYVNNHVFNNSEWQALYNSIE